MIAEYQLIRVDPPFSDWNSEQKKIKGPFKYTQSGLGRRQSNPTFYIAKLKAEANDLENLWLS